MLVIFISHRLAEVRQVADRVTVFRNGATVASHPIGGGHRRRDRHRDARPPARPALSRAHADGDRDDRAARPRPLGRRRGLPASTSTCAKARCWASPACRGTASASCSRRCSASCGPRGTIELWGKPVDDPQPARRRSDRPRRHRAGAGGPAQPGAAPVQERAREPDAFGHPALLAPAASRCRAASGAGRGDDATSCASRRPRPSSWPARSPAATSRR